jgi:hypothetical protein
MNSKDPLFYEEPITCFRIMSLCGDHEKAKMMGQKVLLSVSPEELYLSVTV